MSSSSYKRKLRGWLSYAFASEVFVIVSLTLFLPICLEQFARDNGYLLPDKTTRCIDAPPKTSEANEDSDGRCVVKIGWVWIDTASFSLYVYSFSVFLQALTVISVGGIADHPSRRKRLLLSFAFSGALAATLFLLLPSNSVIWWISAFLAAVANVGFGTSVVAMNSYLPGLAREEPSVVKAREELEKAVREWEREHTREEDANERTNDGINVDENEVDAGTDQQPLLSPTHPTSSHSLRSSLPNNAKIQTLNSAYATLLSQTTSRISSSGIALGYGSGILLLILALVPVTLMGGSTTSLRLAIGLSGIWWGVFTIPAGWWLPATEQVDGKSGNVNGDLNANEEGWDETGVGRGKEEWRDKTTMQEIVGAWKRLGGMLKWSEIKKLRNTFKYLGAWFLLSDGFSSITSTAMLFGKTSLHMSASGLILIGILTPLSAIGGSLVWPRVQKRWGVGNKEILLTLLVLASLVPVYGCLGFLFEGSNVKFGGLTTQGEMYALGVYFGFMYGAFQGYARAFYAELLPPGEEARWYGLFSITDKSSSFIGPLFVGLISDLTGNIRYSFFFLVGMVWAAVPMLVWVDPERGRKDAEGYRYGGGGVRDGTGSGQ
ncbi:MFS general substrate transporter [Dendrothele bispora CBS 962.96]|uniref:Autophagy-related protein n=1 Tax=Dendrothele bispora (strain CBS 962.96) TaxID=1314807 RepID=A0A4S8MHA4_DENBC|nr:MFS general substrate transporter [Dendrothele bispora CBS 962.96]